MMITVYPASATAPFEQIREQIADQIRFGALPGDHRLPSIRQLAADLRVAAGTVAKAYAALEAEGLVETDRARGTRVKAIARASDEVRLAASALVRSAPDLEQALGAVRAAWAADRSATA